MSNNPYRDYYISLESEPDPARRRASQHEVDATVTLARACIIGGFTLAAVLGGLAYAWVQ